MLKHRYFFYDHEAGAFVESRPRRTSGVGTAVAVALAAFLVVGGLRAGADHLTTTTREAALVRERAALREQLALARVRMRTFSHELDVLAERDERVYRTILQARPIPEAIRRLGVSGSDPYAASDGFPAPTANALRAAGSALDHLGRRLALQRASLSEIARLAGARQASLDERPALLPASGEVLSGFGMRRHPVLRVAQLHAGVDVALPVGSDVFASGGGIVRSAGWHGAYGNVVEIDHGASGYTTFYAHLSHALVRPGQRVGRGERIARSGNTGRSTGPHLHYEVRDASGRPVDPAAFLATSLTPEAYNRLAAQSNPDLAPASLD